MAGDTRHLLRVCHLLRKKPSNEPWEKSIIGKKLRFKTPQNVEFLVDERLQKTPSLQETTDDRLIPHHGQEEEGEGGGSPSSMDYIDI